MKICHLATLRGTTTPPPPLPTSSVFGHLQCFVDARSLIGTFRWLLPPPSSACQPRLPTLPTLPWRPDWPFSLIFAPSRIPYMWGNVQSGKVVPALPIYVRKKFCSNSLRQKTDDSVMSLKNRTKTSL
jgi:hypothetical protein